MFYIRNKKIQTSSNSLRLSQYHYFYNCITVIEICRIIKVNLNFYLNFNSFQKSGDFFQYFLFKKSNLFEKTKWCKYLYAKVCEL